MHFQTLEPRCLLSANEVVTVPFSQEYLELPHVAHEQAPITLKAIIRNASSVAGYEVAWDTDRDGDFSDEFAATYLPDATTQSVRDIGRTFMTPNVSGDTRMDIDVRVVDLDTNAEHFGTFKLLVYDFTPSNNPQNWTNSQIEVMSAMAHQESLWFMHRSLTNLSGAGTAVITGESPHKHTTATYLQAFTAAGRLPAYAPGAINTFGNPLPSGWEAANEVRWNNDPYAETALRLANRMWEFASLHSVASVDESNQVGYTPSGSVITANRLPGTTDGLGLLFSTQVSNQTDGGKGQHLGVPLAALSPALAALAGTPIQLGAVAGQSWEWGIQQTVDLLGSAQIDSGTYLGAWGYDLVETHAHATWSEGISHAAIGFHAAESHGSPYGIVVTNRHKYRLATAIHNNQAPDGGARRSASSSSVNSNLNFTGGMLFVGRWLGIHTFSSADGALAFPNDSSLSRGAMRQDYDQFLSYTASHWNDPLKKGNLDIGWRDGFWRLGDYLVGDSNGVYNALADGNSYSMYFHSQAYEELSPPLSNIGGHDAFREFNTYQVRAQSRTMSAVDPLLHYDQFGKTQSTYTDGHGWLTVYGVPYWNTAMASLVLNSTSTLGLAGFEATPTQDVQRSVDFQALAPGLLSYGWDFDPTNGLWWELGGAADASGESVTHQFPSGGNYTVALRVTESTGATHTSFQTITVVDPPPTASTVLASSTQWDAEFLALADASSGAGYAIPANAPVLPWTNLDQIVVAFDEPVQLVGGGALTAGDFDLVGVNEPDYGSLVTSFAFDGTTATFTLSQAIAADKVLVHLPGGTIEDLAGHVLGDDFSFRFDVLPGDANRSGAVLGSDVGQVRLKQFEEIDGGVPTAGYSIWHDLDGSGAILGSDVGAARMRQFAELPAGEPIVPPSVAAAAFASLQAAPAALESPFSADQTNGSALEDARADARKLNGVTEGLAGGVSAAGRSSYRPASKTRADRAPEGRARHIAFEQWGSRVASRRAEHILRDVLGDAPEREELEVEVDEQRSSSELNDQLVRITL